NAGSRGSFDGTLTKDGTVSAFSAGLADIVGPWHLQFISLGFVDDVQIALELTGPVAPGMLALQTADGSPARARLIWRDALDQRSSFDVGDGSITIGALPTLERSAAEGSFALRLPSAQTHPALELSGTFHADLDESTARYYLDR
ncbi:MAG: hypothetical protein ABI321_15045, partial [Polyangia bacterium]